VTSAITRPRNPFLHPGDPVERALTWSTVAASLAKGVLYGVSALFFTRVIGVSAATVGVGLTIAGGVGVSAAFVAGYLSDRVGAPRVLLAATLGQGLALVAYLFAGTAVAFCLIACVALGTQSTQRTAQMTLLAQHFTGHDRVAVRARLRVTTNVFIGLGSASAAGALAVGTPSAYLIAMLSSAVLVLASAVPQRALTGLRRPAAGEPVRPSVVPGHSPLRDRTYLAVTALNAIMSIQFGMLTVGVPLWVTGHTRAPAPTVAVLLTLNTVIVALFQVRAARRARDVATSGRAVAHAGLLLVLACLLYAFAASAATALAVGLLLLPSWDTVPARSFRKPAAGDSHSNWPTHATPAPTRASARPESPPARCWHPSW
jgi:MFS family permease